VVAISNLGNCGAVIVTPATGDDASLLAWMIDYDPKNGAPLRWARIRVIDRLGDERIGFTDNHLSIDGRASGDSRVAVHLAIPKSVKLKVIADGKTLVDRPLESAMMIQDGKVIESKFGYGPTAAIMQSIEIDKNSQ